MDLNQLNIDECRTKMREAKLLWDYFPRKESLNQIYVQNIDLIFFCIFVRLNSNDESDANKHQIQLLLRSLQVTFEIMLQL
jgi:hypothetical protein